jgi:hypothetical protein
MSFRQELSAVLSSKDYILAAFASAIGIMFMYLYMTAVGQFIKPFGFTN